MVWFCKNSKRFISVENQLVDPRVNPTQPPPQSSQHFFHPQPPPQPSQYFFHPQPPPQPSQYFFHSQPPPQSSQHFFQESMPNATQQNQYYIPTPPDTQLSPHTFTHTPHQSYGFMPGEQFNFDSQQPHQEDNRRLSFASSEEELLYNTFNSRHNTPKSATQLLNNMCQQNFQIPSFGNAYTPLNQISNWTQGGSSSFAALPPRHPP
uniref:Velvet complex subunit 2-like n=1 Tax=Cicer arietinum TaxID=3827 RepID=A0A1S2Z539_CICAR